MSTLAELQAGFGGDRAVVIGASTTGLTAAAVAARHFRQVCLLDRDSLPDSPEWRKGVPQSRHVHVLLRGGQNVLERYFPGLTIDLLAQGADLVDMASDTRWHHSGGWKARFASGVTMLCQSKGFLEWNLRRRVAQLPNVEICHETGVRGFLAANGRLAGVRLDDDEEVPADLVIDASGRNSRTAVRLAELGFGRVPISELGVDVGYASRPFRPPVGPRDWRALLVHPRLPDSRLGVLLPIEGGRWLLTLVGWRGDHPPADDAGFMEFTRSLPVPDLYHAVRHAEPLEPVRLYRFPTNLRRHYERMPTLPDGLVVVGDAACSFNPIYAQGMSSGAIGASILDTCLVAQRRRAGAGRIAGLARLFQRDYAKFIDRCWLSSTTEDYGSAEASGERPLWATLANWYLGRIHQATWSDQATAQRFIEVMHMLRPPAALLDPAIALRALTMRQAAPLRAPHTDAA